MLPQSQENKDGKEGNGVPNQSSPQETGAGRNIARKTLLMVGNKASSIITHSKSSSVVLKFGIETMEKIVQPARDFTVNKFGSHADHVLTRLDRTIDRAINTVHPRSTTETKAAPGDQMRLSTSAPSGSTELMARQTQEHEESDDTDDKMEANSVYSQYWTQLKEKFVNSRWYSRVDEILLQNCFIQALTVKVVRPAEAFYQTVTEEFVQNENIDEFMAAVKKRIGIAWDDRLTTLAKAFYTTASAVQHLVGAGKFVGGALQLGRAKLNERITHAIDDILAQWDRVLNLTDEAVDRWLPDTETKRTGDGSGSDTDSALPVGMRGLALSPELKALNSGANSNSASSNAAGPPGASQSNNNPSPNPAELVLSMDTQSDQQQQQQEQGQGAAGSDSNYTKAVRIRQQHRSLGPIAEKVGSRLRQRSVTNLRKLGQTVQEQLRSSDWFKSVDDILLQNYVIQTMTATTAKAVQPAEHFFQTCLRLYSARPTVTEFVTLLKQRLGAAWNDRLAQPAASFFATADEVAGTLGE